MNIAKTKFKLIGKATNYAKWASGTLSLYIRGTFDSVVFKVIWRVIRCTFIHMACGAKTAAVGGNGRKFMTWRHCSNTNMKYIRPCSVSPYGICWDSVPEALNFTTTNRFPITLHFGKML